MILPCIRLLTLFVVVYTQVILTLLSAPILPQIPPLVRSVSLFRPHFTRLTLQTSILLLIVGTPSTKAQAKKEEERQRKVEHLAKIPGIPGKRSSFSPPSLYRVQSVDCVGR